MSIIFPLIKQVVRRILTVSGSAIIAYLLENGVEWIHQGFQVDERTVVAWAIIYPAIEAIQKGIRLYLESKKIVPPTA